MRFEARYEGARLSGRLLYIARDHAIDFTPAFPTEFRKRSGKLGEFSVTIDTLELLAGIATAQLVSVRGYFPRAGWRTAQLQTPPRRQGRVLVDLGRTIDEPAIYGIPGTRDWERLLDESTGWVMAGDGGHREAEYVEFLEGAIVGLRGSQLVELWLHPDFVETAA